MHEQEQRDRLLQIGCDLNAIQDLDILMERILTEARDFVDADAGSIYILEDRTLRFAYTQNDTLQKKLSQGEKLLYSTFTLPVNDRSIAGYVALYNRTLCIDDVYRIPETAPYRFSRSFDVRSQYRSRSMCTLPLTGMNQKVLGVLQILNALAPDRSVRTFTDQDIRILQHFASIASLALERAQLTRSILLRMIQMAEMRDPKETGAHVNRVGSYAVVLYETWARRRDIDPVTLERQRDRLRMAAMLHDVGKVAIPDHILKKPGRFTEEEFLTMQQHTLHGARLFLNPLSDFDHAAAEVALTHHERWDGKGYPGYVDPATGLPLPDKTDDQGSALPRKGEEIPLFGRIVALADVYDALSHQRVYKEAWEEERVLGLIRDGSGTQFDPELVEIFFECLDTFQQISLRFP
ncbi:HD domain-containing phosphohydrolase [Desulfobotulus sp.]|jgi:HD-GYP domain-containing protein (c-di-GMP phosphodiesterase class II)|uniref:HD domain-containing phosphohydrolase n=1 Tax=Desulfobotulus sp. TaxID=1940337 RepID=UPI002A36E420|nr:HD domain-containing phosphohydrolase [Desulfobotulus sp.]MDY0163726.1 HD domain-containing protein [Desulfobotulus sp.]